jgi:uncharacterized protein
MKFNPKAKIDRSQIEDRRGQGGRRARGGGIPGLPTGGSGGLPGGLPAGGGIGGIVLLIIILVVAAKCGGGIPGIGGSSDDSAATFTDCNDGSDSDQLDCRIGLDVTSVQNFWTDALPEQAHADYVKAATVIFGTSTDSGCGQATEQAGPFFCPVDKLVYIDPTFFDDMLKGQLGAEGGEFSEAYVMAHEYGHHVQDLLGTLSKYQSNATGPTSASVRIELQADCYAGVWAHAATTVPDADGNILITEVTDADIADAINAATAVGDDRIQQQTSGRVNQEQWTHGSSEERVRWFSTGYKSGQMSDCDTFSTDNL